MKNWTLQIKTGEGVQIVEGFCSADAAKREAKERKRWNPDPSISFKILDPAGNRYQFTEPNGSWRLRWRWV